MSEYAHLCGCPQPTMYQAWRGLLPCSSLFPRALVGEASRNPLWPEDSPAAGLNPEGGHASSFLSQSKQRRAAVGNGTVQPALSTPLPHSPEHRGLPPRIPRPLEGGASHGLPPIPPLTPPLPPPRAGPAASAPSVLGTGEPAKGWRGVCVHPHMFRSVNNLH